jgi:CheY-like chemotaxis protein
MLKVISDGQAAIDYFEGRGPFADRTTYPIPNYLLLDLKLPQNTGIEVLQWLRGHPSHRTIPVIIFSSSQETEDLKRAGDLGIDEYVVKPMGSAALPIQAVKSIHSRWKL